MSGRFENSIENCNKTESLKSHMYFPNQYKKNTDIYIYK